MMLHSGRAGWKLRFSANDYDKDYRAALKTCWYAREMDPDGTLTKHPKSRRSTGNKGDKVT